MEDGPGGKVTARKPYISSLRRGLQAEHLKCMIDLTFPSSIRGEATKPISNLAVVQLRKLQDKIGKRVDKGGDGFGSRTLSPTFPRPRGGSRRSATVQYTYNAGGGGGGFGGIFFKQPEGAEK